MAVRTCICCAAKKEKQDLVRFVWKDEAPVMDEKAILEGRGVYCCRDESCLEKFAKQRKKYKRIFRLG